MDPIQIHTSNETGLGSEKKQKDSSPIRIGCHLCSGKLILFCTLEMLSLAECGNFASARRKKRISDYLASTRHQNQPNLIHNSSQIPQWTVVNYRVSLEQRLVSDAYLRRKMFRKIFFRGSLTVIEFLGIFFILIGVMQFFCKMWRRNQKSAGFWRKYPAHCI